MIRIRWPPWRRLTAEEHVVEAVHLLSKIAEPIASRKDGSRAFAHLNTTKDFPFTLHFTIGPMAAEIIERETAAYDGPEHG